MRVPLSRRIEPSSARQAAIALLAGCALIGSLGACGVRLEADPPAIPSPPASEVARSAMVASAEDIAAAARDLGRDPMGTSEGAATLLAAMESGSSQHIDRLGGLWTPPPRPSATASTDDPSDPRVISPAQALTLLVDGYAQAKTSSASVADANSARLFASIALWRASAAYQLSPYATIDGSLPVELPTGGVDLTALSLATFEDVNGLIRGLDAAAFGYEVLAARNVDEAQRSTWVQRADALRNQGQVLAVAAGLDAAVNDPRSAVYDVSGLISADSLSSIATIETSLAALWINADVAPALRPLTVDAALASIVIARQIAPLAPLDSSSGVLPGLSVPAS